MTRNIPVRLLGPVPATAHWLPGRAAPCLAADMAAGRRRAGASGGIWCLPGPSLTGPFDTSQAVRMAAESLYSGRLVRDRAGRWVLLAFRNRGPDGRFVGELTDPMPVRWTADGTALTIYL
jgi:beta-fructofuranosidase